MTHKYDKKYFEEYARLSLKFILPYSVDAFIRADKPDLQNKIDGIGIEVTRADQSYYLERLNYGFQYLGKKPSTEELKKFKGEFFLKENGCVYAFSPTKGMITVSAVLLTNIKNAIKAKKEKFPIYKESNKELRKIGLYCFSDLFLNEEDLIDILKIDFSPFDFLIINFTEAIYLIQNHTYTCYNKSSEDLKQLKEQALHNS